MTAIDVRIIAAIVLAVAILSIPIVHASDPQSYTVTFPSSGNGTLDATLKGSSTNYRKRCGPKGRSVHLR